MVMRVERRGDEYCVVLTQQALDALRLTEGTAVEIRPVATVSNGTQASEPKYVTVAEALASYERTEPLHSNTYRELAK
jgi:antitoxin component of MazEF toxin-antitoxin module